MPIGYLSDLGVGQSDLEWLVSQGYVTFRGCARGFQRGADVAVGGDPRFTITEAGAFAAHVIAEGPDRRATLSMNVPANDVSRPLLPSWDSKLRVLVFGGCVVKRFRLPASNQEAVFSAFEAEGWPPSIYDPLPYLSKERSKRRLHETIRHLNANHQNRRIRFRGNGTGEAVLWEPITAPVVDLPAVASAPRRAA